MIKNLSIGTSDFKDLIQNGYYFVDKSLIIKDLITNTSSVILIPRPRRFGKTLNMSMIRYFFDLRDAEENCKLFDGLKIKNEKEFSSQQGKYPVIYITFKDIKDSSYDEAIAHIRNVISEAFLQCEHWIDVEKISGIKKNIFDSIKNRDADIVVLSDSIKLLTELIYKSINTKPILLIDEYDTPIHVAYTKQFYDKMVGFMSMLLGAALKDNSFIHKGLLTGTLRVSKESIFTGLNNPSVYTILDSEFNQYFGFTPEELTLMLTYYGLEQYEREVQRWYNGYIFGKQEIYNPWSISKFIASKEKRFIAHWINTSSNDLIKEIIKDSPYTLQTEINDLLEGKQLIKTLNENISFPELKNTDNAIYSFLVFSGYLKASYHGIKNDLELYALSIPNIEVKHLFSDIILSWFKETFRSGKSTMMLNALFEKDTELFGEILGECVLESLSAFDTDKRNPERVYQAFILGLLISLAPEFEVTSNKESGYGRYDICIVPLQSKKPCIIMELKSIRLSETHETALASALKQIEDKQYEVSIRQRGYDDILKIAVVFDGKRVWVKS